MDGRPILCVDVDGVINLFDFTPSETPASVTFELIEGVPHAISHDAVRHLQRLDPEFECVWATGWGQRANEILPGLVGVGPLLAVEFEQLGSRTNAFWKTEGISEFAGSRALAWIDDSFDDRCYGWASRRERSGIPTLLVPTDSDTGLEGIHVDTIKAWAREFSLR